MTDLIAAVLIGIWTLFAIGIAVYGARRRRSRPIAAAPRPTGHVRIITRQPFDWERDG